MVVAAATAENTEQIDEAIKRTVKTFKAASAMQVWTWSMNREGNLLAIEQRLEELARAGRLKSISNAFPASYTMGKWK